MAVRFDANNAKSLSITASAIDYNSPYTVCCWWYPMSAAGYGAILTLTQAGFWPNEDWLILETGQWFVGAGTAGAEVAGSTPTLNNWYHLTLVRTSVTQVLLYVNGILDITHNHTTVAGRAASTLMYAGWTPDNGWPGNGRLFSMKAWQAALSLDEIVNEMLSIRPLRTENLYGFWPIFPGSGERGRDYGGNGHPWTENGTLTDEDPPPLSWGVSPEYYYYLVPIFDQSAFRWRNDDNDEANATWRQSENVADTHPTGTNFRLRVQIQTNTDQPSHAYKLQYRQVGASVWRDVP